MLCFFFFFFNDTATTEIYTLSLHDALPISRGSRSRPAGRPPPPQAGGQGRRRWWHSRSEWPPRPRPRMLLGRGRPAVSRRVRKVGDPRDPEARLRDQGPRLGGMDPTGSEAADGGRAVALSLPAAGA